MSDNLPLPKERTLFFGKDVSLDTVEDLSKEIIQINENDDLLEKLYKVYDLDYKRKPIKIMIDSYGGSVYQCLGLISIIETSKTKIHTYVTGTAMSCGFIILICGHKRFGYKHATTMFHQISTVFWGNVQDMKENYQETKRLQNKVEKITLDKTNISNSKLKEILTTKKDWYMNTEEALSYGVIDEIV